MADLVAGDLTYSFSSLDRKFLGRGMGFLNRGTITFGDGSDTVPAAGVPLTKGKMGCPRELKSLKVIESSVSGYTFEYDASAEALKLICGNNAAPAGSIATVSGTIASVSGTVASASQGVAPTFTGVAPTFTGVAPTFTGTAITEASSLFEDAAAHSPAAMTLLVEAIGY